MFCSLMFGASLSPRVENRGNPKTLPSRIVILDWNAHHGSEVTRIVEEITRQHAAIAVLQEVDFLARRSGNRDLPGEIARRAGMSIAFGPAFRELSQGDSATTGQLTMTEGRIVETRLIPYRHQTGFWKPRWWIPNLPIMQRREGGRSALVTVIEMGGTNVAVYNLHLESRSTRVRDLQLEETLEDAGRYGRQPVVLAGDFNTLWGTRGVRDRMARAGFRNCYGDRAPRTHKLIGSLDYIFVRGAVECSGTEVIRGVKASDHDPVRSSLSAGKQD